MKDERFIVTYRIEADTYEDAKSIAWAVQVEQTIEFPYEFVTDPYIKNTITGRLESLESMAPDSAYATVGVMPNAVIDASRYYLARISYHVDTTALEATQFLNVVFGNSSLQPHIWVVDIELCPTLFDVFKGPRFGLHGIRRLVETPTRPMIQAVIKPMGTPNEELARMCAAYTRGGVDVIKDDHGITNQSFSQFKDRVRRCAAAVREMNEAHGKNALYAANVSGDGTDVLERAYLSPGVSGIADYLQLGFLPRLFGADMMVFVSYGGRFTFTQEQCKRIAAYIKHPVGLVKAGCPAPGGGVTDARLTELVELYGNDTMFLVGGDMFRRGPDLESNMAYFVNRLDELSQLKK